MDSQSQKYSIWIEAEEWADDDWHPVDDNTDVIVTFENGEKVGRFILLLSEYSFAR